MDRVAGPGEDGLSSLLRDVRVRSVVYCLSDFAEPWGFSVERSPVAKFHVLLHGTAALTVSGARRCGWLPVTWWCFRMGTVT
jgi:hypothetical protein